MYEKPTRLNFRPATAAGYSRTRNGRNNSSGGGGGDADLNAPTSADIDAVSITAPSLSASIGAMETSMWSCGHFTLTLLHLVQGGGFLIFDHLETISCSMAEQL